MAPFLILGGQNGAIFWFEGVHFDVFNIISAMQRLRRQNGAFLALRSNFGAKNTATYQISPKAIYEEFLPQI